MTVRQHLYSLPCCLLLGPVVQSNGALALPQNHAWMGPRLFAPMHLTPTSPGMHRPSLPSQQAHPHSSPVLTGVTSSQTSPEVFPSSFKFVRHTSICQSFLWHFIYSNVLIVLSLNVVLQMLVTIILRRYGLLWPCIKH